MATVMYIPEKKQSLGAMKGVMGYVCQEKKTRDPVTGQRFVTGVHCLGDNACREFLATKRTYGKTKGMNFYQYVQSFSPKEAVTLEKAHAFALEFAQKAWPGFEVLVATHRDAGHLHSHFVVNSVSWETGLKLRQSPKTLQTLRALSDEICAAQGLSVLPRYEKPGAKLSSREYRAAQKGESWKFRLMGAITQAMERSGTRRDFLRAMERRGYQVAWEDNRKYITYTTPGGRKCRDIRLHQDKFRKENMEYEFAIREEHLRQLAASLVGEEHPRPGGDPAETLHPHGIRHSGHHLDGYGESAAERRHTFQPTLYQKLQPLATWEEVQELAAQLEETQEQTVQRALSLVAQNNRQALSQIQGELEKEQASRETFQQQVGKEQERFTSKLSEEFSAWKNELEDFQQQTERRWRQLRRRFTLGLLLSWALACGALWMLLR